MNKKRCQIYASLPITCFEVPIIGQTELNLTEVEIYKCLCAKAEVIEILPDGKRINLDFTNYNKDNSVKSIPAPVKTPESTPVIIKEEIPEPAPIIEEKETIVEEVKEEETIVIEDKVEVKEEEVAEELKEEVNEDKKEEPVAETVKSYQVASRNNNHKKSKNNKK